MNKVPLEKESIESVITTGNYELDRRIGGIPIPTLLLIEGDNNSGKSVFVQQLTYGALKSGYRVLYITTENTVDSLIRQMESLSFNVKKYFLAGKLNIFSLHVKGVTWNHEVAETYLTMLSRIFHVKEGYSIFVVDSLSYIAIHSSERDILEFFTDVRNIVDREAKSVFLTMHKASMHQDLMVRIRSICDAHITLSIKEMRDRIMRFINVNKMRGASKSTNVIIGFEVDPAFGIKVIPFSAAKA